MTANTKENGTIQINDLIKVYKHKEIEVAALRGLSCSFPQGEINVIMGPSGCGKTTLLNIIGGISRPTSGSVILNNRTDITQFSEVEYDLYRRDKISYIFQSQNLLPNLTAWNNIILPLQIQKKYTSEKSHEIETILDFVGMTARKNHFPDELSGGEQQRVSIARALAKNADILLCDEPTGELDSKSKSKIMELLLSVKEKNPTKTIIIVTHDLDFKLIADRVFIIKDGRISYEISGKELVEYKNKNDISLDTTNNESGKEINPKSTEDDKAISELEELKYLISQKLDKMKQKSN